MNAPARARFALFALGFRPFFLAACLYAVLAVVPWWFVYTGALALPAGVAPFHWHAHEMVWGYAMAVIAGFLLTAVRNWTGEATPQGAPLAALVLVWALARAWPWLDTPATLWIEGLWYAALIVAVARPIVRARQWRQLGILSKLLLLAAADALYHLAAAGHVALAPRTGLYLGLYLVLALVLTIGRRVIPFFTERGVGEPVLLRNHRAVDAACLIVFLLFAFADAFAAPRGWVAAGAAVLAVLHAYRLAGWFTPGILRRPLLWSLHLGYAFIVAGFALYALSLWLGSSPFPALHAFAYGGIGLTSASMMARVSLGHTGRNVHAPPPWVGPLLGLLAAGALLRVAGPLLVPAAQRGFIAASALLWVLAFLGLAALYLPLWCAPRADGRPD
ncbi:MAG: hypothetical protein KatS3mg121_0805 [Gammaproteobacteria bacterium]|nr:MAG: hypothetical protein KatS3mg121_0805 [Gammaproteobacteria bacterium]